MSEASRLLNLKKLGQSVWYDNISRELLLSGGLKEILGWGVNIPTTCYEDEMH